MQITINGIDHTISEGISITALMKDLQIDPRKVAIEQNLCIVPANEYAETYLNDGDILEVVQFIGGG